jgi:hypothetical protein
MKSSQILASVLFGSMAAAIPFKRDLVTKTEVAIETVIVYTTVWDDDVPVAEATTTAGGYFYEQPASSVKPSTTPAAVPTPVYTPPAVQAPSSVYTPPVETPAAPSAAPVVSSAAPAPKPVESSAAPAPAAPTTTEAAAPPAPVSSAPAATSAAPAAPAAQQQSSSSSSTGESFSSVDLTINPLNGALGACGEPMHASDFYVALAAPAWGASTYDSQTGKATNKWCGQKIKIEYNGKSVDATIMDLCPGCSGHDLDLSDAAWEAIGMTEWTRVQGSWSIAN